MKITQTDKDFTFNADNVKTAKWHLSKYPKNQKQSAVMPLLDLAQRQNKGWLSKEAIEYVANYLDMPIIKVYEVASFYTMYNLQPVGKYLIEVCTTTPCWLNGSDEIVNTCKKTLGININETTKDGKFTLQEAECLGACVNAPMMQIGDDYYEDLNSETTAKVLEDLKKGKKPKAGSLKGRQCSAALGYKTS